MTSLAPPIPFEWTDDGVMRPLGRFTKICDAHFVVGEQYTLVEHLNRSQASHSHFFAALQDAYDNLPEEIQERYLSVEHLRKAALCATGHCNEMQIACASRAEALRTVATIKALDTYAICAVRDAVVLVRTAHSQSMRAMGKEQFQASKIAVLEWVANLIGTDAGTLAANAGRAA